MVWLLAVHAPPQGLSEAKAWCSTSGEEVQADTTVDTASGFPRRTPHLGCVVWLSGCSGTSAGGERSEDLVLNLKAIAKDHAEPQEGPRGSSWWSVLKSVQGPKARPVWLGPGRRQPQWGECQSEPRRDALLQCTKVWRVHLVRTDPSDAPKTKGHAWGRKGNCC